MYGTATEITFDPAKNKANRRKHGIDLANVEGVFHDPMALTREDRDHDEDRYITLGVDGFGRLLVVAYTYRGAVAQPAGKTRITIFVDDDVLVAFRERAGKEGKGYQILINQALREALNPGAAPLTVETLRQVLREEMHAA